jgi:peptidoglycan/LPS O-acetylase OafA/YrhL
VGLVVLYHFAPSLVPGGFLGVDVFFVLSGFLITSLALGEHHGTGRISAPAFFGRRARRLLPAAITTIVVTVAVAVALDPSVWRSTIRGQAVASLLYVNNWWSIAQDASYQVVFGAESPLNHFWSLSIEEQFYIVFPLALLGLAAVVRRNGHDTTQLARLLLVVASVGAVASALEMAVLYDPLEDPSRLYYGTDTRLQAVLLGVAGGCAAWLWRERWARRMPRPGWSLLAGAGTAVVVVASWRGGFLQSWLYRGGFFLVEAAALLVVLSVVAHRGGASRVFEARPLVTLGLFSYGIYLWHWPVKVFLDPERTGLDGVALFALRVAVTAVATYLSYRLVERPFRSPRTGTESARMVRLLRAPRGAWIAAGAVAVALAAVWVLAVPTTTSYGRSVDLDPAAASPAGADAPLRVMWTGDSVAWTLGGGRVDFPQPTSYETVFDPAQVDLWNLGKYSCQLLGLKSRSFGTVRDPIDTCVDRDVWWPLQVDTYHPDVVVWDAALYDTTDVYSEGRWIEFGSPEWDALYLAALDQARLAATGQGATFVLLGQNDPIPIADEPYQEALRPENVWRFGHLRDLQRSYAADHPADTRFVDLQQLLCPAGLCEATGPDGTPFRPDGVHWRADGARRATPLVTAAIYEAIGRPLPG